MTRANHTACTESVLQGFTTEGVRGAGTGSRSGREAVRDVDFSLGHSNQVRPFPTCGAVLTSSAAVTSASMLQCPARHLVSHEMAVPPCHNRKDMIIAHLLPKWE